MNRTLQVLVVLEALAIVVLLALYLSEGNPAELASPGSREAVAESSPPKPAPPVSDGEYAQPIRKGVLPDEAHTEENSLGITLMGTVTDSAGVGLSQARVTLTSQDGTKRSGSVQNETGYAVLGLSPGAWSLKCSARNYHDYETQLQLKPSPRVHRLDLVLKPAAQLKIRIETPEGESLREILQQSEDTHWKVQVIPVATVEHPGSALPMTDLRDHSGYGVGRFQERRSFRGTLKDLPKEYDGVLILKEPLPLHVSAVLGHVVLATVLVPEGAEECTLVVSLERVMEALGTIRVRVADFFTNEPLVEAKVAVSDRQTAFFGTKVDENGEFLLENQRPGILEFEVTAPEYERVHHYIRLDPGQDLDMGTLRLRPAEMLKGLVLGVDGKPAAGIGLSWRNLDRITFPQPLGMGRHTSTDDEGHFQIAGFGRNRYLIYPETEDMARNPLLVDTRGGVPDEVVLTLQTGTEVQLDPELPTGKHFMFTLSDQAGIPVMATRVRGDYPIKVRVLPGSYMLEMVDDAGSTKIVPIEVGTEPAQQLVKP